MKKLGLSKAIKEPWRREVKKKKGINLLTGFIAVIGIVLMISALLAIIISSIEKIQGLEIWLYESFFVYITMYLIIVIIGLSLVLNHFMRRYKKKVEFVNHLENSLEDYKESTTSAQREFIEIPLEEYDEIARLERDQISYERQKIINISLKMEDSSEYSIQKSREAQQVIVDLDESSKLAVEDTINDLSINPEDIKAVNDPVTNLSRIKVPDIPYKIEYIVDHENLNIKIISLKNID